MSDAEPPEPPRRRIGVVAVAALGAGAALALYIFIPPREPQTCIARGTRVRTPGGNRFIEDLRTGDAVLSVDPVSGLLVPATVTAIASGFREVITLDSGRHRLTATMDHPVYDPRSRSYRQVRDWCDGSAVELLTPRAGNQTERVQTVATRRGRVRVYDITLSGRLHNFIANGVVVHNKSPEPPPCEEVQNICYPAELEPRCSDVEDCEARARAAYDEAVRLASSSNIGDPYRSYRKLHDAKRFRAQLVGLSERHARSRPAESVSPPPEIFDSSHRVFDVGIEVDRRGEAYRRAFDDLKWSEDYTAMAKLVREWQSHFPDEFNTWRREADEVERRMKSNGTWPPGFDDP